MNLYKTTKLISTFYFFVSFSLANNIDLDANSAPSLDKFNARTAVVDVEAILEHSEAIKNIKKSINLLSSKIQSELSSKEINLKKIESDLIKQRGKINERKFNQNISAFNKKVTAIQQDMQQKKSSLEQAHAIALKEVHNNTIAIIAELSQKYHFNIVLPSSQVLYTREDLNITPEVISLLNQRLENVEVKYELK